MNLEDLVEKYDINDGFKKAISNMLSHIENVDIIIEMLTDKFTEILYQNVYENEDYLEIDDGSNVRIGIENAIRMELKKVFKEEL